MFPQCPMLPIHVINSENDSAPPPVVVFRTRDQVDESFASIQTTEPRTIAAVQQLESKLLVEFDGTSHVTDGQRHCADVLDRTSRFHNTSMNEYLTFPCAPDQTDQRAGSQQEDSPTIWPVVWPVDANIIARVLQQL